MGISTDVMSVDRWYCDGLICLFFDGLISGMVLFVDRHDLNVDMYKACTYHHDENDLSYAFMLYITRFTFSYD